ncbi:MAG: hypothetical protein MPJ78_08655, partial [Hyphomicrobiaceae bacterium]|nr:hypothetical protein [Hyphomicrobiaceae bacterium]
MADKKNAKTARRRRVPFVFKALALCFLAFVALLILLPAPPEIDAGGTTQVARHVPKFRDTVDPIATDTRPVVGIFPRAVTRSVTPNVPAAAQPPARVAPPVPAGAPAAAPQVQQEVRQAAPVPPA